MTGMNAGWTYLNNAEAATPFSLCVIIFALLMIPGGKIQDKISPKFGATLGGLFLAVGCIIAGMMQSYTGLSHRLWYLRWYRHGYRLCRTDTSRPEMVRPPSSRSHRRYRRRRIRWSSTLYRPPGKIPHQLVWNYPELCYSRGILCLCRCYRRPDAEDSACGLCRTDSQYQAMWRQKAPRLPTGNLLKSSKPGSFTPLS